MDIYDEIYWESLPKNRPIVAAPAHCCAVRPETVTTVINVSSDNEEDGGSSIAAREAARAHGKFVDIVTIESDSSSASLDGHCFLRLPHDSRAPRHSHHARAITGTTGQLPVP